MNNVKNCQRIGGCLHNIGYDKCCCDDNSCDFQETDDNMSEENKTNKLSPEVIKEMQELRDYVNKNVEESIKSLNAAVDKYVMEKMNEHKSFSEKGRVIYMITKANIEKVDWWDEIVKTISDKYAKGYLACQIEVMNNDYDFNSEEMRKKLLEICDWNIWGQ